MRVVAYVRRGARAGICVLALGVTTASAQEPPAGQTQQSAPATTNEAPPATTNEAPPAAIETTPPASTAPTSNLPELVVDGDAKKKKKVAKAKQEPATTSSTSDSQATSSEPPPPGVTLGTAAPSDTGTSTFDAKNVTIRTDGSSDANSFARNLPNVQYQNYGSRNAGSSSQSSIDTKPEQLSISGARVYENNFIINGVSVTNITGSATNLTPLGDNTFPTISSNNVYGGSPQTIFVPSEFVGQATIIDSNASAEYGQFQGGVVSYDLVAPPTDRYHATVSAKRDSSEWASYILATPLGNNPNNRLPPRYVKDSLAASVGAPITKDFSFILQASRQEAESSKQYAAQISNGFGDETSDNIFYRFAATARTDIGKFTFDTSHTDYFQRWFYTYGNGTNLDMTTDSWTSKLQYDTDLAGVRMDAVGLGRVKLMSRVYYNTSETLNSSTSPADSSGADYFIPWWKPGTAAPTTEPDWCHAISPISTSCYEGGFGHTLQGQTDYGVQANLSGNLLLGNFLAGTEVKRYEGRSARLSDFKNGTNTSNTAAPAGTTWNCAPNDVFCSESTYLKTYSVYGKRDIIAGLNAAHSFAELDQTLGWFNVRAGLRHDYDDYFKNNNFAPRLVGTFKPFDGLSFTGGYNRYYLGETLYYALRDNVPANRTFTRGAIGNVPQPFAPTTTANTQIYSFDGLATPYDDEYTAAISIKDPFLGGGLRLKYLERYGRDQFATVLGACNAPGVTCTKATNDGETFYRSASAEYTKEWNRLNTPFFLNAAAFTGNVTWSAQENSKNTYLLSSDLDGNNQAELLKIFYNGQVYSTEAFSAITGNLDIPVRFGAVLSTIWFDGLLELNANAGINLGFEGVTLGAPETVFGAENPACGPGPAPGCTRMVDRKFNASLKLDINGQINVTKEAAIQFSASNITNSSQQAITTIDAPWVLGRSYYIGSALRF